MRHVVSTQQRALQESAQEYMRALRLVKKTETASLNVWENALAGFAAQLRAAHFAPNSIDAYCRDTQHFVTWVQQKTPHLVPQELSYRHVDEYRHMLLSAGRQATTVNRRLGAIRQFSAWAKAVGLTPYNIGRETDCLTLNARQAPVGPVLRNVS